MNFGDIRGTLEAIIKYLKEIARHTKTAACACTVYPTAGTGTNVPAGLRNVTISQTSSTGTDVLLTFPDSSTYTLSTKGQSITFDYADGILPAIDISSADGGTWQWVGVTSTAP